MKAVNLIPSEQRSGGAVGARSGGAVFLVLGLLGGFVVLALLYGLSRHQLESRRAEAATLTKRAQEIKAQATQLAPYTAFMAMREQRLQAIAQLVGSRFDWSSAMGELSRVLPGDVALTTLQGTIASAAATSAVSAPSTANAKTAASGSASASAVSSATPPGATPTFTLGGCAASQTVVAQVLVRLRLISGVSSVTLQSSTKSGSSGSGGGACPSEDPVFNIQVSFQPLPAAPALSTEAPGSTTPAASSGVPASRQRTVAAATGGLR
jgi:Tfp pilus assembly protein PilN